MTEKPDMPTLPQLGDRICIIGPSSSGKSTLAEKLAARTGARLLHLDQIAHAPGTNWQRRPNEDFIADHNRIVAEDRWVIEGNYSICMPQRFDRATAIIWLDPPLGGCVWRYLLRCLKDKKSRIGGLEGATQEFNPALIQYTLVNYPRNRLKYAEILRGRNVPVLHLRTMRDIGWHCRFWGV